MHQLMKSRRHLELQLEDLPCEHDSAEIYETSDQLLEPLILCYESLVATDVKEVLDTFRVAAELGSDSLGAYVISMASNVFTPQQCFTT
ncbi:hypothetical protein BHE74_00016071 [Ensete ventricosum]|nr:hypothetical protein BHE74_00016071 [Ensete ventricosum]RZS02726.1 hypothetical protein BHM03_00032797 [Ensete ventricosum]